MARLLPAVGTGVFGLAVAFLVPQFLGNYLIGVATTLVMWIALVQSWVILSGLTGYISLGHAAFFGIGAYVMVLTWALVPLWASILAGGAAAAFLALVVGYPVLRVRGPYFVILTFGVAEFVKHIVINIEAGLGKFGRLIIAAPDIGLIFQMMLGLAVVASLLAFYVRRSRFGTGLRAIREDETAAQTTGVPVTRFKVIAFTLSALIPGMAGALVILRSGYFEPLQAFNPLVSLTIIAMAVIGGSDDAPGPVFGALFLVVLSELLWASAPQAYMMLLGLLLIVFVLSAPDGLYGRLRQLIARSWG